MKHFKDNISHFLMAFLVLSISLFSVNCSKAAIDAIKNIATGGSSNCGNGFVDAGEQCDSNGTNSATCIGATCQTSFCGDNTVNSAASESCEPPGSASCSNNCQAIMAGQPYCGDGIVNGTDLCDGNGIGTGGETTACNLNCTISSCGDGIRNATAGEVCDPAQDPTCNSICSGTITAGCGNGVVETGELCDDSNLISGDGCSSTCQFENLGTTVSISGTPSGAGGTYMPGDSVTISYTIVDPQGVSEVALYVLGDYDPMIQQEPGFLFMNENIQPVQASGSVTFTLPPVYTGTYYPALIYRDTSGFQSFLLFSSMTSTQFMVTAVTTASHGGLNLLPSTVPVSSITVAAGQGSCGNSIKELPLDQCDLGGTGGVGCTSTCTYTAPVVCPAGVSPLTSIVADKTAINVSTRERTKVTITTDATCVQDASIVGKNATTGNQSWAWGRHTDIGQFIGNWPETHFISNTTYDLGLQISDGMWNSYLYEKDPAVPANLRYSTDWGTTWTATNIAVKSVTVSGGTPDYVAPVMTAISATPVATTTAANGNVISGTQVNISVSLTDTTSGVTWVGVSAYNTNGSYLGWCDALSTGGTNLNSTYGCTLTISGLALNASQVYFSVNAVDNAGNSVYYDYNYWNNPAPTTYTYWDNATGMQVGTTVTVPLLNSDPLVPAVTTPLIVAAPPATSTVTAGMLVTWNDTLYYTFTAQPNTAYSVHLIDNSTNPASGWTGIVDVNVYDANGWWAGYINQWSWTPGIAVFDGWITGNQFLNTTLTPATIYIEVRPSNNTGTFGLYVTSP